MFFVQLVAIVFGGLFSLILALGYIASKRSKDNVIPFFLFFCLSIIQLYHGLVFTEVITKYSMFIFSHIPFLFFLGPLIYHYFNKINDPKSGIGKSGFYSFIPGIISVILIAPNLISDSSYKSMVHGQLRRDVIFGDIQTKMIAVLIIASVAYIIFFIILALLRNPVLVIKRKETKLRPNLIDTLLILYVLIPVFVIFIALLLFLLGWLSFSLYTGILLNSATFISFFPIMIFILGQRYTKLLKIEEEEIRYRQSQLRGVDVDTVLSNLSELMDGEKVFCDEDLSLKRLSAELNITPHQLSEILNEKLGVGFYTYINDYRVRESIKLIQNEPERDMLSIGYAVGFNSKSAFYKSFKRVTGTSPGDYIKIPGKN